MRGALAAGAHYVDLGGLFHVTQQQLELDDEFREAGLTAILGMGSAPGKTNLLAASGGSAARAGSGVDGDLGGDARSGRGGHPFPAPYSVQTLRDELQMRPVVLRRRRAGRRSSRSPARRSATSRSRSGARRGIYTLHSELATLPLSFPSLREASFRLCLSPGLLEKLLALEEGELPEPYVQSPESVAVHESSSAAAASASSGDVTRGGSAKSTSEPAARGAFEIAEGRLEAPGCARPRPRWGSRGVPRAPRHGARFRLLTRTCGPSHASTVDWRCDGTNQACGSAARIGVRRS